ncbi:MAG: iron-only hydrogenase system regulator [Mogibacterium sp.]|nr:iron-only hydrogenase system regulator [Mogibacterium sp.]
MEETRVAILGIIVENNNSAEEINALLHEYSSCIIGRFGIPYRERGISIICIVMDAAQDAINTLSGRIGKLKGVNCKVTYSNVK